MLIFWLPPGYIIALLAWLVILVLIFRFLLQHRRFARLNRRSCPDWRKRLISAALAAWTLLSTLTLAEIVFAGFVDHSEAFNATLIARRWYARHFDSQRNADGFRERRLIADMPPDGTRRMLILGDSFTAGHGINNIDDRFTEKLESQLNRLPEQSWQVYNMGEPGYEISMIRALQEAVLTREFPVDVIVYCYMMNDIEGYDPKTQSAISDLSQRRATNNWLVRHSYFVNWMYHRWIQFTAGSSVDYFPHLAESYAGDPWNAVVHDLDDMLHQCRQKSLPFQLVIFPFMHNLGPEYPFAAAHNKLIEWANSRGVPVLDMRPIFESRSDESLTVNPFDNHPNIRAHELIAEALLEWLRNTALKTTGSHSDEVAPQR